MSLYKQIVPLHTCTECGKHIDEFDPMWTDGVTCICEECATKDNEEE